jgi:hypothetical protein
VGVAYAYQVDSPPATAEIEVNNAKVKELADEKGIKRPAART